MMLWTIRIACAALIGIGSWGAYNMYVAATMYPPCAPTAWLLDALMGGLAVMGLVAVACTLRRA